MRRQTQNVKELTAFNCKLFNRRLKYRWWMVGNEGFDRSSGRDPPLLTIDICHTRHISSIVRILIPQILRISPLKNPLFFKSGFYVTNGWEWGIRTPDGGFRVPCLTTWRIPRMYSNSTASHLTWRIPNTRLREGLYRKEIILQIYFLENQTP